MRYSPSSSDRHAKLVVWALIAAGAAVFCLQGAFPRARAVLQAGVHRGAEGGIVDMIRIVSMDTYDEHGYPMYYFKNAEKHGYRVDHAEEWLVQVQGRKAQYTANVYLVALDGYKFSLDDTLTVI